MKETNEQIYNSLAQKIKLIEEQCTLLDNSLSIKLQSISQSLDSAELALEDHQSQIRELRNDS